MKKSLIFFGSLILIFGTISSCNLKDKLKAAQELTESAEDQNRLENEYATVYDMTNSTANQDSRISGVSTSNARTEADDILPGCATKTYTESTKTLVIDFGTTDCTCKDGVNRRGKIVAVFTGAYRTAGSTMNVTLQDYYVQGLLHTGSKLITNLGNTSGNFKYSYKVTDAAVYFSDETIKKWSTDATIERIAGDATTTPFDDVYLATGSSKGTNRKGVDFTVNIVTPLKKRIESGCARSFVSGTLKINTSNGNRLDLDYDPTGGEPCDRIASVSINGGTARTITTR